MTDPVNPVHPVHAKTRKDGMNGIGRMKTVDTSRSRTVRKRCRANNASGTVQGLSGAGPLIVWLHSGLVLVRGIVMYAIHRIVLSVLVVGASGSPVTADTVGSDAEKPRLQAAAALDKALRESESTAAPDQQLAALRTALEEAVKLVPANVVLGDVLKAVEQSSATSATATTATPELRDKLVEARDMLRFEPQMEAPLPEGFPEPTPVGEIRVQKFPEYRLAKTDMTFFEGRAFWTLFNHIKKHDIAMTAPVEMQYTADAEEPLKQASMAFLYRSTQQGTPGTEDKVDVTDIPAHLAVSIGLRGDATKQRVAEAKQRLEAWIAAHSAEYEASGPLRVMGYNSPFVPDAKRFTEVQIPVRAKNPASAG